MQTGLRGECRPGLTVKSVSEGDLWIKVAEELPHRVIVEHCGVVAFCPEELPWHQYPTVVRSRSVELSDGQIWVQFDPFLALRRRHDDGTFLPTFECHGIVRGMKQSDSLPHSISWTSPAGVQTSTVLDPQMSDERNFGYNRLFVQRSQPPSRQGGQDDGKLAIATPPILEFRDSPAFFRPGQVLTWEFPFMEVARHAQHAGRVVCNGVLVFPPLRPQGSDWEDFWKPLEFAREIPAADWPDIVQGLCGYYADDILPQEDGFHRTLRRARRAARGEVFEIETGPTTDAAFISPPALSTVVGNSIISCVPTTDAPVMLVAKRQTVSVFGDMRQAADWARRPSGTAEPRDATFTTQRTDGWVDRVIRRAGITL